MDFFIFATCETIEVSRIIYVKFVPCPRRPHSSIRNVENW